MAQDDRTYQAAIEIDTSGTEKKIDVLKKDIKDLKKQTDKASESAKDLAFSTKEAGNQNNQFAKMSNAIQDVYAGMKDTIDSFEEYAHDVANQSGNVDNSFATTGQQIKKLEKEYQEMMNSIDMTLSRSIDMPSASSDTLQDLENLRTKVQFIYRDIIDLYEGTLTQLNNVPTSNNEVAAIEEFADAAEHAAEASKEIISESEETADTTETLDAKFTSMTEIVDKFYHALSEANDTLLAYTSTADDAGTDIESFIDIVDQAAKHIEAAYQDMYASLKDVAGENWDSIDAFSGIGDSCTNAKYDFREVADAYDALIQNLKNGGEDESIPSLEAINQAAADLAPRIEKDTRDANGMTAALTELSQNIDLDLSQSVGNGASNAIKQLSPIETIFVKIRTQTQKLADPLRAYASEAEKARERIDEIRDELHQVQSQKLPTENFIKLNDKIAETKQELQGIQNALNGTGLIDYSKMSEQQISEMKQTAEQLEEQFEELNQERQDLLDSGEAYTLDVDWESITKLRRELQGAKEDYKDLTKEANTAAKAVDFTGLTTDSLTSGLGGMVSSIIGVLSPIAGAITSIGSTIMSGLGSILKSGLNLIGNILQQILNLVVSIAKAIWNALKKAVSVSFDVATNIAKMVSKPVLSGVKSLAKWIGEAGLSLAGFNVEAINGEGLIKKLTNAVDEFMGFFKRQTIRSAVRYILNDIETVLVNIAKIDDEFNESMSNLIDSAKALGAQIVAIIEPIVNTFGPYLVSMLDWLTGVADVAAQFVARITGNDTYVKASKGQSDYASSLDDTTKSTQKATKATQEYQNTVLAFDQLNKLDNVNTVNEDEDESIIGVSDADLKKAQTQDSALNDIADDIYKAFTNKDWSQIGKDIGQAITRFFDWLDELVGWDTNKDTITRWAQNLVDMINGIIVDTDWAQVGRDIGDILNTIIEFFGMITDPETGVDFRELGKGIGTLLENAIKEIHWEQLGRDIVQGLQAAVNFVVGILDENIGYQLGKGFAEAISGIADAIDASVWADLIVGLFNNFFDFFIEVFSNPDDFATIGSKIGTGIADALNRLDLTKITTAMNNIWVSLTNLVSNFITSFEESYDAEDGQSVWTSLGKGLMEGLQGIMDWLTENILNGETGAQIGTAIGEFFGGLVDSFDPETWSAFFTGIGNMLSELLVNMFSDTQKFYEAGAKLAETLVDMLTDSANETADEAGDEGSSLGQGVKAVLDAFLAVLQGFFSDESTLTTITGAISDFFQGIWGFFTGDEWSEEWDKVKEIFNQVLIGLFNLDPETEDPLGEVEDIIAGWLADFLSDVIDKILPHPFRAIGEGVTGFFSGIGNAFLTGLDDFVGLFTKNEKEMVDEIEAGSDEVSEGVERASEQVTNSTSSSFADMANEWVTGSDEVDESIEESADKTTSKQDEFSDKILSNREKHKSEYADSVITETDDKRYVLGQSQDEIDEEIEENADKEVEALDTAETKTTTAVKEADWCGAEAMSVELQEGCVTVGEDYDNYIDMTDEQSSLLQDALNYAMDSLGNILGEDWCGSEKMQETLEQSCADVYAKYGDYIDMNDEQSEALKNGLDTAIGAISNVIGQLTDTNNEVEAGFDETEETIDTEAEELANNEDAMNAIESYFDSFSEQLMESFDEVDEGLFDNWDEVREDMMENAQEFIDDDTVDNAIVEVFNRLSELINSMTNNLTTDLSNSISSINLSVTGSHITASIPHMASGGWLDDGQLFYANENGPELIGRYGTGTGVMNNSQIVDAVSDGVRSAVVEAMNSTDSGDIVLYIDSEEIARASTKGNRSIQKRTNPVVSFA